MKIFFAVMLFVCVLKPTTSIADVYGGGYWEAIGIGNMPCSGFLAKIDEDTAYKEIGAVWLSGFMSGVNYTSSDVYDITWGEDIYVLTDLVVKRCTQQSKKIVSDIATEMVYKRYQEKNYTSTSEIKN